MGGPRQRRAERYARHPKSGEISAAHRRVGRTSGDGVHRLTGGLANPRQIVRGFGQRGVKAICPGLIKGAQAAQRFFDVVLAVHDAGGARHQHKIASHGARCCRGGADAVHGEIKVIWRRLR